MASFTYWEKYTETDLTYNIKREFERGFKTTGEIDEVKSLVLLAFSKMPRYNYRVLTAREDALEEAFKHLYLDQ